VKAYVISLPASQERRAFQRTQLGKLGLDFCIVDAVSTPDLAAMDKSITLDRWERVFMPTEVACFFSHYRLWQTIASGDRPGLILEDDVLLSSGLPAFLERVKRLKNIDHITLETRLRKKLLAQVTPLGEGCGIARLYQDRTGAAAYILWPQGAAKLLAHARNSGAALADAFISNFYGLQSWQAVPALAIQSDVAKAYGVQSGLQTHSYIQANDRKANYQLEGKQALVFKVRRIAGQLKLARRFLARCWYAKRKFVDVQPTTFQLQEKP
jgi:glycosyl transferase, family 25